MSKVLSVYESKENPFLDVHLFNLIYDPHTKNLRKGFTNMLKCKSGRRIVSRSIRYRIGYQYTVYEYIV